MKRWAYKQYRVYAMDWKAACWKFAATQDVMIYEVLELPLEDEPTEIVERW